MTRPAPADVRHAKKFQLLDWCIELGLAGEGTVDELRARLLEHLGDAERGAPETHTVPPDARSGARLEGSTTETRHELPRPTPPEVRRSKKAQLQAWGLELGLGAEGTVDELRGKIIEYLEAPAEAQPRGPGAVAEEPAAVPTPSEVRAAKKAQLTLWCEQMGLEAVGTVDVLRARIVGHLEAAAESVSETFEAAGRGMDERGSQDAEPAILEEASTHEEPVAKQARETESGTRGADEELVSEVTGATDKPDPELFTGEAVVLDEVSIKEEERLEEEFAWLEALEGEQKPESAQGMAEELEPEPTKETVENAPEPAEGFEEGEPETPTAERLVSELSELETLAELELPLEEPVQDLVEGDGEAIALELEFRREEPNRAREFITIEAEAERAVDDAQESEIATEVGAEEDLGADAPEPKAEREVEPKHLIDRYQPELEIPQESGEADPELTGPEPTREYAAEQAKPGTLEDRPSGEAPPPRRSRAPPPRKEEPGPDPVAEKPAADEPADEEPEEEAIAEEPDSRPTPAQIRKAKKAQLIAWCEQMGLDSKGSAEVLRTRILKHLEEADAEEPAPESELEPEAEGEGADLKSQARGVPKSKSEPEEEEDDKESRAKHVPKSKPKLEAAVAQALKLRREMARRRPAFRHQEWFRYARLGEKWRNPKGMHSKIHRHFGYRPNVPSIGYRGPRAARGLHPSGFREVLVHNVGDLEAINPKIEAARIARTVGLRKRLEIQAAAVDKGIRVLNRRQEE